jgi:two-component system cell cycle response regulator
MAKEENPDLILLDIKMPMGGGIKAFDNLRNNIKTENIPVIFITAYPSAEVKKQVIDMGADGFISKPFSSEELLNKIRSIIGL